MNITVTGPTAAGKTTHAQLIATALQFDYVSASEALLRVTGFPPSNNDRWITDFDALAHLRRGGDLDRVVDEWLLDHAVTASNTVYDSWTFAHLYNGPAPLIRIFLSSDLNSRTWKCRVSQEPNGPRLDLDGCRRLIEEKDRTSAELFGQLYGIDVLNPPANSDIVIDNGDLITGPTIEAARTGIRAFHRRLLQDVRVEMAKERD